MFEKAVLKKVQGFCVVCLKTGKYFYSPVALKSSATRSVGTQNQQPRDCYGFGNQRNLGFFLDRRSAHWPGFNQHTDGWSNWPTLLYYFYFCLPTDLCYDGETSVIWTVPVSSIQCHFQEN